MKSIWTVFALVATWAFTAPATIAGIVLAGGLFTGRVDRWDTTTNTVTTFSDISAATGSAPGIVGMVYNPVSNRVLVAGRFNNTIYELNATTGAILNQRTGSLNQPAGIAVDSAGNIYVANNGGNTLTRFSSDFSSETVITMPNFGAGDNLPSGLAFDSTGRLIISTFVGVGVVTYDPGTGNFASFNSTNPVANGLVAVDSQDAVYVGGAAFSNSVTKFDSSGTIVGGITIDSTLLPPPSQSFASPDFTSPSGVSIDGDGNILVAALGRTNPASPADNNQSNGGLFLFNPAGTLLTSKVQTTPYTSVIYFTAVPEPSSILAASCGLGVMTYLRRRKKFHR